MIHPKNAEIMSPAGSYESLTAAVKAGADSVYFGVTQLNMRARAAANFTLKDLEKIMEICHKAKIKWYLVVNTLLYDHDVVIMRKLVDAAKKNNVDAIIAFDFATVQYCNEINIPVHISVQFSLSNYESVKFFAQFTNRVVLARELTVPQIKAIHDKIIAEQLMGREGHLMEIEAFIHGALCVAQSGRCFMSLYTHNASANRGACLQNCRTAYKVTDMDTGKELVVDNHYIMSAADICTIDFLDELLDAGVMVMKIEGRGRSAEYVDTVVKTYKLALKDIENWAYTSKKIKEYYTKLETVYNRHLSKGNYYLGKELGDYSDAHGSKATTEKETIWRVTHFYPKVSVAEIIIDSSSIKAGQTVLIIWASTWVLEFIPEGLYIDGIKVEEAKKGQTLTIKVPDRVRENDKFSIIKSRVTLQQSTNNL